MATSRCVSKSSFDCESENDCNLKTTGYPLIAARFLLTTFPDS